MIRFDHSLNLIDKNTDKERLIERNTIHVCGERNEEDSLYQIPFSLWFKSDLSSKEHDPVFGVHSTLREAPKVGYTQFPVIWSKDQEGKLSVEHKMVVNISTPAPWPRDAAICVQLFAHSKSSEGVFRLQKTGSCLIPLIFFVDDNQTKKDSSKFVQIMNKHDHHENDKTDEYIYSHFISSGMAKNVFETVHSPLESNVENATYEVPIILQSSRMLLDKPFYKGSIIVKHKYGSGSFKPTRDSKDWGPIEKISSKFFRDASLFDITRENIPFIESRVMLAIQRDKFPFSEEFSKKLKICNGIKPSIEIMKKVNFPFFVTDAVPLPGNRYFTNHYGEDNYNQKLYTKLIEISLERNFVEKEEFIKYGKMIQSGVLESPNDIIGGIPYDTKWNLMASSFVEACTILPNSIPYVADYDDFNHDRRSRERFSSKKYHVVTESCDDPFAKGADDCEGVSNAITRIYRGFRDMKNIPKDNQLLHAAQNIAKNYMCFAVLGSVDSRNIKESGKGSSISENPLLDSPEDIQSGSGAHMWTMFIPMRQSLKMFQKTWTKHDDSSVENIKWTDGTTYKDYAVWTERLPVLVGEGTGMLNPRLAPISCYESSIKKKVEAITTQAKKEDAIIRVMVGQTMRYMKKHHDHSKLQNPGELENMDLCKNQDMIIEHKDRRLSTFYQRIAIMYPVVTEEEQDSPNVEMIGPPLPKKWQRASNIKDSVTFINEPETIYSWRSVVPVQMFKDRPEEWSPKYEVPGSQFSTFDMKNMYRGVAIEDVLFKRDHIAFIRIPENTPAQEMVIRNVTRMLPPCQKLEYIDTKTKTKIDNVVQEINDKLQKTMIRVKGKENVIDNDNEIYNKERCFFKLPGTEEFVPTHVVRLFSKAQDMQQSKTDKIIEKVVSSPFVIGAKFVSEVVTPVVGTIRLDIVVNNKDSVELKQKENFEWITEHCLY